MPRESVNGKRNDRVSDETRGSGTWRTGTLPPSLPLILHLTIFRGNLCGKKEQAQIADIRPGRPRTEKPPFFGKEGVRIIPAGRLSSGGEHLGALLEELCHKEIVEKGPGRVGRSIFTVGSAGKDKEMCRKPASIFERLDQG
jgi:hypothetical protein